MGHHETTTVEHIVRTEPIDELARALPKNNRLLLEQHDQHVGAMTQLDVLTLQPPQDLGLVIALHTERDTGVHHIHHDAQAAHNIEPTVDEIADEDHTTTNKITISTIDIENVPEHLEQLAQLLHATVHITDHIEEPALLAPLENELLPDDLHKIDLILGQDMDLPEPLLRERRERALELAVILLDHDLKKQTISAHRVPRDQTREGHIERDDHTQQILPLSDHTEQLTSADLETRHIDHHHAHVHEAHLGKAMHHLEHVHTHQLIVLIVADKHAHAIKSDHLRRDEVLHGETGLTATGHADQHNERRVRNAQARHGDHDLHLKTD